MTKESNYYTRFLERMIKSYKNCSKKGKPVKDFMYSKDTGATHCNECGNPVVIDNIKKIVIHDMD